MAAENGNLDILRIILKSEGVRVQLVKAATQLEDRPATPLISIGIGMDNMRMDQFLGAPGLFCMNTYGYYSSNGWAYFGLEASGQQYGPKFGAGDTIGTQEHWRFKQLLHPIHLAVSARSIAVLEMLLKHGASIYQTDEDDWTPLHFASHAGWCEGIVRLLDQHKASMSNRKTASSAKPAAGSKQAESATAGFVDACTKWGSTPLLSAIKNSQSAAARILINQGGADCSVTDEQGRTLLMFAARTGNVGTMTLLIKKGVAVKTKDLMGRTALQYACNEAAVVFLEKQGNKTIEYEGREYLLLRVDTEVRKGAVGQVVLAKLAAYGNPVAIKYHSLKEARDVSFDILTLFSKSLRDGNMLPDNQCRFIFECLVRVVQFVHGAGYVHHDLKACNFVRFFEGRYKLIDFDNCREANTEMGFTTAEICPPEMAAHPLAPRNSRACQKPMLSCYSMESWALGCVLYQMTTHRWLLCDVANWDQGDIYKQTDEEAMKAWRAADDVLIQRLLEQHVLNGPANAAHELLTQLLCINPKHRIQVGEVLSSTFLKGGATMHTIEGHVQVACADL
ncbi:hypothetical protein WJX72_010338 [[Myrmecia] bisecta]|uniref:Protein kinase domain-containing protein n=1 Tax=[Myrmecia] bisecta TaxID=41462 RepID=A0AAW1Q4Q0_9CHLO